MKNSDFLKATAYGPIYPDNEPEGEWSTKLIAIKTENGPDYWDKMREIFAHDCETLPMEKFKTWMSVWSVPLITMKKRSDYVRLALNACFNNQLVTDALVESFVGVTKEEFKNYFEMFADLPTTMNRMQALSHLIVGKYVEKVAELDTIVELGAGIGDLADIIYKLGFKGKYYIYDLPEVQLIQKYYHKKLGHKTKFITKVEDLPTNPDLVIATWSLTEMPLDLRNNIIEQMRDAKEWLIAYSSLIFGIDNDDWIINKFAPYWKGKDVEVIPVPFMSWDGGTYYVTVKEPNDKS